LSTGKKNEITTIAGRALDQTSTSSVMEFRKTKKVIGAQSKCLRRRIIGHHIRGGEKQRLSSAKASTSTILWEGREVQPDGKTTAAT